MRTSRKKSAVRCLVIAVLFSTTPGLADWMLLDEPPDVDKTEPDLSCYLATASNMLAGAGYGDGGSVHERAQDLYAEFMAQYDEYT